MAREYEILRTSSIKEVERKQIIKVFYFYKKTECERNIVQLYPFSHKRPPSYLTKEARKVEIQLLPQFYETIMDRF